MASPDWSEVALLLAKEHAEEIASAIFTAQRGLKDGKTWFLKHSDADQVLDACVEADPAAVWRKLSAILEEDDAYAFVIGFGEGLVDRMPRDEVLQWVGLDPARRGGLVASLCLQVFGDDSLASALLEKYGHMASLRSTFMSHLTSGVWAGPLSEKWAGRAAEMDRLASNSGLEGVRRWARESAMHLRRLEQSDRKREAEDALRRW